jgi:hypothetical protein
MLVIAATPSPTSTTITQSLNTHVSAPLRLAAVSSYTQILLLMADKVRLSLLATGPQLQLLILQDNKVLTTMWDNQQR